MTTSVRLYQDMRVSEGVSSRSVYGIALEQAKWCDERGLTEIWTSEHHGHDEVCSPLVYCGAVGAVTRHARIMVGAILLPLLDPIRLAEDIITADLLSQGRVEVVIGLGYARHEYEMFGTSAAMRGRDADEKLPVVLDCLEGRPFAYRGRHGTVAPRPYQDPRPPVLVGGSVKASATRAARYGDGFAPNSSEEWLLDFYRTECERFGHAPGPIIAPQMPFHIHVTDDPERDWAVVGPHLLDEINLYGHWAAEAGEPTIGYKPVHEKVTDISVPRNSPQFALLTPEQCIDLAKAMGDRGILSIKPLRIAPEIDLGWKSLQLFYDKVVPHLDMTPPAPAAIPRPRG